MSLRQYLERREHCLNNPTGELGCLAHRISQQWENITGTPIVDGRDTWSGEGVSNYLAKYLAKTLTRGGRDEMEALGFSRRYSTSRDWPKVDPPKLDTVNQVDINKMEYISVNHQASHMLDSLEAASRLTRAYELPTSGNEDIRTSLLDVANNRRMAFAMRIVQKGVFIG